MRLLINPPETNESTGETVTTGGVLLLERTKVSELVAGAQIDREPREHVRTVAGQQLKQLVQQYIQKHLPPPAKAEDNPDKEGK